MGVMTKGWWTKEEVVVSFEAQCRELTGRVEKKKYEQPQTGQSVSLSKFQP